MSNRYVTDEQRRRRPIFIATLRAGASWLFFCVALSTRIIKIWVFVRALKKQPTDSRQSSCYFGDRTLGEPTAAFWQAMPLRCRDRSRAIPGRTSKEGAELEKGGS